MKGFAVGLLSFLLFLSLTALGLALTLHYTILNPDFVISEIDKVDPYSLVKEQIEEQFIEQIPEEGELMAGVIDATLIDLEPWLKEEVKTGIYSFYDYLMGRSQRLSLVIATEPIKETLRDNLWEALQQSPPPELEGLPQAEVERYFDESYQQIAGQMPTTFELDESLIPAEAMLILEQVRRYVGYVEIAYMGLIGLTIVLIAGIILINRRVKASTRGIGITFLTYGAIEYGGIFAIKQFATPQIAQIGLPAQLQGMIPQLFDDLVAPLQMFSLAFLAAGIVLIIVSHVYKRHQPPS